MEEANDSDVFRALETAEDAVCEIIRTTGDTLDELGKVPDCNPEKLKALAEEFVNLVQTVQLSLTNHLELRVNDPMALEDKETAFTNEYEKSLAEINLLIENISKNR